MGIFNVLHNIYLHTVNIKSTKIQYQYYEASALTVTVTCEQ